MRRHPRHFLRAQVFHDAGKELRCRGEIEEPVAVRPLLRVDAFQLRFEPRVACRVVEVERAVADVLCKLVEPWIGGFRTAKLDDALTHVGSELIAQRAARHADDGEFFGQQVGLEEVIERRQQLALGEVA